jgi:hypothetical protein
LKSAAIHEKSKVRTTDRQNAAQAVMAIPR